MQTKSKQRLVGLLILLAILAIFLPLLFHNSHPTTSRLSVKIPPKPKMDKRQQQVRGEVIEQEPVSHSQLREMKQEQVKPVIKQKTQSSSPSHEMKSQSPKTQTSALSTLQLKKAKAVTSSEQKGLNEFMQEPKAWAVQLGTFHNIENAKRLINKLRAKGFDAYTRPILDSHGNHLLRVYVGPEIRRESAVQLRNKLQMSFNLHGVVRKYSVKM